jgi:hypothetical protein
MKPKPQRKRQTKQKQLLTTAMITKEVLAKLQKDWPD